MGKPGRHKQRGQERGLLGLDNPEAFSVFLLGETLLCPPHRPSPRPSQDIQPESTGARPEIIRDGEQTGKGDIGKAL